MSTLTYPEAIVVGLFQGVSELFPASSLGHTVLIPALVGGSWARDLNVSAPKSPYLAFIVGLHVATAAALILYFWRDWLRIIGGFFSSLRYRRITTVNERLAWMIIIATIPVGISGLALEHLFRVAFSKAIPTSLFLFANGLILLWSERKRQPKAAPALAGAASGGTAAVAAPRYQQAPPLDGREPQWQDQPRQQQWQRGWEPRDQDQPQPQGQGQRGPRAQFHPREQYQQQQPRYRPGPQGQAGQWEQPRSPEPGYQQRSGSRHGYPEPGYPEPGYPEHSHPEHSHPEHSHPEHSHAQHGHAQHGHAQHGGSRHADALREHTERAIAADRRLSAMGYGRAFLLGAVQTFALLPGISRDGIVTATGMLRGMSREDAVRFSFLLSAPVILAAGMLKVPDLFGPLGKGIHGQVLVGSLLSFIGAYVSVRFLVKYFSEARSLRPFGIYCIAAGLFSLFFILAFR